MNKYHVSNSEGKFAAGSGDDVLENKLQLSETNDINDAELVLLETTSGTLYCCYPRSIKSEL